MLSKYLKVLFIPVAIGLLSLMGNILSFWIFLLGDIISVIVLYYLAYRKNLSFIGTALCGTLYLYLQYALFVVLFVASENGLNRGLLDIVRIVLRFMPSVQLGLIGLGIVLSLVNSVVREFVTGNRFSSRGQ